MPKQQSRPDSELAGGQRRRRESDQVVRALRAEGPASKEELATRVGATYWEGDRFDQCLTWALGKGLITQDADGRLSAAA